MIADAVTGPCTTITLLSIYCVLTSSTIAVPTTLAAMIAAGEPVDPTTNQTYVVKGPDGQTMSLSKLQPGTSDRL